MRKKNTPSGVLPSNMPKLPEYSEPKVYASNQEIDTMRRAAARSPGRRVMVQPVEAAKMGMRRVGPSVERRPRCRLTEQERQEMAAAGWTQEMILEAYTPGAAGCRRCGKCEAG